MQSLVKVMANILMGVDITEVYSPERCINLAKKYGLKTGLAMDLMTGYDFDRPEDRKKAWNHLKTEKPMFLIGSPSCREFSVLQHMNKGNSCEKDKEMARSHNKAVRHHEFCMALYREKNQSRKIFCA